MAVYLMGYNYRDGTLTADEFNAEGDPQAAKYMLGSGVELSIMPTKVLHGFRWRKADVGANFKQKGGARDYLVRRWATYAPKDAERVRWDVAIFEAYLHPARASQAEVVRDGARGRICTC